MTSDQDPNAPRMEPRFDGGSGESFGVDPYDRPAKGSRRTMNKRVLAAAVALAAFGGFAGIAWYATSTGQKDPSAVVPVITADNTPVKERPAEPGGLEVPNRDMRVFNQITPSSEPQKVEQLLPPAEQPMARPQPEAEPPSGPKVPDAPEITTRSGSDAAPRTVGTVPVTPARPPQNSGTESAPKDAATNEPAKAGSKPDPQPQQTAKVAGGWRVQVGASRDETRARTALARIVKSNSDLLGGLPTDIQRADLGSKGIFYRMRAGAFADRAEAEALCKKLTGRKVSCAVVQR